MEFKRPFGALPNDSIQSFSHKLLCGLFAGINRAQHKDRIPFCDIFRPAGCFVYNFDCITTLSELIKGGGGIAPACVSIIIIFVAVLFLLSALKLLKLLIPLH